VSENAAIQPTMPVTIIDQAKLLVGFGRLSTSAETLLTLSVSHVPLVTFAA
jgi:hypothetical protein